MADEIPTEALEAAAHWFSRWFGMSRVRKRDREYAGQVLAAAAPFLIAEGRRQAAAAIRAAAEREDQPKVWTYIVDFGIPEWAAQIAEGLTPADRAERQLRESRERQAGLDMDRIERARDAAEARSRRFDVLGAEWAARIEEGDDGRA